MLWSTSFLLCGQSCIIYAFSSCRCTSSCCCLYVFMDIHTGLFTEILMAFMFIHHSSNFLFSVFCIAVLGQSGCHLLVLARLVYDEHPVLVYSQYNVLYLLGQCSHILVEYCNKWIMLRDDLYFHQKACNGHTSLANANPKGHTFNVAVVQLSSQ